MDAKQYPATLHTPQDETLPVVTISRQLGSAGNEVAAEAAAWLGFRCVSREVINQAALQANAPAAALAAIDDLGLIGICPSPKECRKYREAVRAVMMELAAQGRVIIIGRAGQVILRERPNTLHVRVIAPLEIRAARLMQTQNIPHSAALAQIEASDRTHHNYLRRFYHVRWEDPDLYDLVINTGRLSIPASAALIQEAVSRLQQSMPATIGDSPHP